MYNTASNNFFLMLKRASRKENCFSKRTLYLCPFVQNDEKKESSIQNMRGRQRQKMLTYRKISFNWIVRAGTSITNQISNSVPTIVNKSICDTFPGKKETAQLSLVEKRRRSLSLFLLLSRLFRVFIYKLLRAKKKFQPRAI